MKTIQTEFPLADDDLAADISGASELFPQIRADISAFFSAGIRKFFIIGCGGSWAATYWASHLMETKAIGVEIFHLNADEFRFATPSRFDASSAVIVVSHSGTTPEAVEAAKYALKTTSTVVGLSPSADLPLPQVTPYRWTYGSAASVFDARHVAIATMSWAIIEESGYKTGDEDVWEAVANLPVAMREARLENEVNASRIGELLKDEDIVYILGAGPMYGTAYQLATCYFQEMQWKHAVSLNADEYFHGAFETTDAELPIIIMLGEDGTRPMAERALAFARRYSNKVATIDSRNFSLPGIAPVFRGDFAPFAMSSVVSRLSKHLAASTGHSLGVRRYMWRVEY